MKEYSHAHHISHQRYIILLVKLQTCARPDTWPRVYYATVYVRQMRHTGSVMATDSCATLAPANCLLIIIALRTNVRDVRPPS